MARPPQGLVPLAVHPARTIHQTLPKSSDNGIGQQQLRPFAEYALLGDEADREDFDDDLSYDEEFDEIEYYYDDDLEDVKDGPDQSDSFHGSTSNEQKTSRPVAFDDQMGTVDENEAGDDDAIDPDILSAFGLTGVANFAYAQEEKRKPLSAPEASVDSSTKDTESESEVSNWQPPLASLRLPALLLNRPTPPGKKLLGDGYQKPLMTTPKTDENHRESYGLSAASVYARLQPNMRYPNGTRVSFKPGRPYRRRPVSVTTTTTTQKPEDAASEDESPPKLGPFIKGDQRTSDAPVFDEEEREEGEEEREEEQAEERDEERREEQEGEREVEHIDEEPDEEPDEESDEEPEEEPEEEQEGVEESKVDEELEVQGSNQQERRQGRVNDVPVPVLEEGYEEDDDEEEITQDQTEQSDPRPAFSENETVKPSSLSPKATRYPVPTTATGTVAVPRQKTIQAAKPVVVSTPYAVTPNQRSKALKDPVSIYAPTTGENQQIKPVEAKPASVATPRPADSHPWSATTTLNPTLVGVVPAAKPVSLRELMSSLNLSVKDLLTSSTTTARPVTTTKRPKTTPESSPRSVNRADAKPTSLRELMANMNVSVKDLLAPTTTTSAASVRAGSLPEAKPVSLSELLASKNLSVKELLQPTRSTSTTTATPVTADVSFVSKPISLRELFGDKNPSLKELLDPQLGSAPPPAAPANDVFARLNLWKSARSESTWGQNDNHTELTNDEGVLVAPTTTTQKPAPIFKSTIEPLKPLVFGGMVEVTTTTTTKTTTSVPPTMSARQTTTRSRPVYVAPISIGAYGTHVLKDEDGEDVFEYDDDEDEKPGVVGGAGAGTGTAAAKKSSLMKNFISYGAQRPIATSRLTPAPPRKSRPSFTIKHKTYNEDGIAMGDDDEEELEDVESVEGAMTGSNAIATHFNADEISEEAEGYFNLPVSVQSAIIVSSAIGGSSLLVFLVILVVFRVRQKSRIRLRHRRTTAALLGLSGTLSGSGGVGQAGSDGSSTGVTTPIPPFKGGYAKLPLRSSSLWGTLRRSMRQLDSNFSY